MQTYLKAAICAIVLLSGQSLSAQVTESAPKHSAMVSRMATNETAPSFDATIMPDSSETKFILIVENPQKSKLNVRVYHSYFGELFSKEIKEELYRNRFDLSNAEDGYYTVEISCGRERIRKQIQINTYTNINRRIVIK